MKISKRALKSMLAEALEGTRIIRERPWSVEYSFSLQPGDAEESEGASADGFVLTMLGESGTTLAVHVDSYWNPQAGDKSGNSIKIYLGDDIVDETYVPVKFDDGTKQVLLLSNAPVPGLIAVAHAPSMSNPPVVHLIVENPFSEDEDVEFEVSNLGNGRADVEMHRFFSS